MKNRNKIVSLLLISTIIGSTYAGCAYVEPVIKDDNGERVEKDAESTFLTLDGNYTIEDNYTLYENWDYDEVTTMYLTVRSGNESDGTNHTWQEVNTHSVYYYDDLGIERYKVEGLLQVGDENGPIEGEFGYGQYVPNTVVQIRGQTSSRGEQKNYRITVKDGKGDWEGQTTINLNKHLYEGSRFSNMLMFYWMSQIDGMMSARTKFVHLYVKDETASGESNAVYQDYGLYTYVEQVNKSYLRNHNQDKNGQLYKVEFFEFYPYEDVIMLKSDADYNLEAFEEYLEVKGSDDHSKLIQMLQELNDYGIPIEETFAKWFDEENYFTWLAFHILVGNIDTQSRNMFLYSPNNINKFYILSWDNDAAMKTIQAEAKGEQEDPGFAQGISNYWGNILHRRVLQSDTYRQKLDDKINDLREFLTEEKVQGDVAKFSEIVKPYIYSLPDIEYSPLTEEEFDYVVANYYTELEENYQTYLETLEMPMPFYIGDPQLIDDKTVFEWDSSFDFDRETITYHFELSRDYSFTDCIYEEDLLMTNVEVDKLSPGQYFYRVTAKNTSGYEQKAFDYYNGEEGKVYGTKCFWVTDNGEIQVDAYESE